MTSPKTPPPPDPVATAAAQSGANRDTAMTQAAMNMINQVGPDGSLTYSKTGEDVFTDSLTGKQYTIPKYTATQTLSESGQRIQDINNQTMETIAGIGRDQSARISELLGKPIDLSNEAVEGRIMELGSKRLDPRFAREEEALRTRLVNQGIRPGTAAFDAEMSNFNQGKNDAVNQLLLTGRGQAVQEMLTERNAPINEINALLSGSQVDRPSFINTPQTQVGGTDYQGAVYASHNAAMQNAQMKAQSQNALMGGLFGLAGSLGSMGIYKSDRRLKRDIVRIGQLDNGLPVYSFRYRDGDDFHIGLMSDDVRETRPGAVHVMPSGFDAVDYVMAVQ
jgi:hypothetical protein